MKRSQSQQRGRKAAAVSVWGLMLTASAGAAYVQLLGESRFQVDESGILIRVIPLVFATVGVLLALRVPENRMGWVFLAGGSLFSVYVAAYSYYFWGVVFDWPGLWFAAWINYLAYMPSILTLTAVPLLLFPTGLLPSRKWRWVAVTIMTFIVLNTLFLTVSPEFPSDELAGRDAASITAEYLAVEKGEPVVIVDNPLGIEALRAADSPILLASWVLLLGGSFVGPALAMGSRFRSSRGTERMQLKWLALSATVAALGLASFYVVQALAPETPILGVLVAVGLAGAVGIPVTAGLAIARYRLYDIDRLVSRTISYALLAILLGLVYAAGAVWLPARILGEQTPVYVAASTLLVAGLFNPLRKRVHTMIDQRFNRSAYNADFVAEAFNSRLAERLTTTQILGEWERIVDETLQPQASAIWIKQRSVHDQE